MESSSRPFERVLVIMLENQYRCYVMDNPYFKRLSEQGINMTNYFGAMHPSQTNYIASTAGELCNVTDDKKPSPMLAQRSIVDIIEESPVPLTWKAYMESYSPYSQMLALQTTPNQFPTDAFPYVIKHNPFSSYSNIVNNPDRWAKVQGDSEFFQDIINGTLPNYAWFTPNMWNDGHYLHGTLSKEPAERAPKLVDQAGEWLESFFGTLRFPGPDSLIPKGTLVVVTWDEADFEAAYDKKDEKKYFYDGPNQIYTVLLGDMIKPGEEAEGYNHYSLLRTIEKNFDLKDLGKNDKGSNWFQFLWDEHFAWEAPEETPIKTEKGMAASSYNDATYVMTAADDGALSVQYYKDDQWSSATAIGLTTAGKFAMASCGEELMLTYQNTDGNIMAVPYVSGIGMGDEVQVASGTAKAMSIAAIDHGETLMLAWANESGELFSLNYTGGKWDETPAPVGFSTLGDITLEAIGASVYLIYQAENNLMNVVSYNTAPFNIVTIVQNNYSGPYDNTTINKWSPSAFPVAHFSHAAYPGTPKENEPITQPYQGAGPLSVISLNGVMHLTHLAVGSNEIMTETFSIPGLMTPKDVVSYDVTKATTTNDGYGTLAQAGWTEQAALNGIQNQGTTAMAGFENGVALFYQPAASSAVMMVKGGY